MKYFALSTIAWLMLLFACSDDDSIDSSKCDLSYDDLTIIGESELPASIVEENYEKFDNIDSLNAFTLEICDLGRYLFVQVISTVNEYNFEVYDSCAFHVASGTAVKNDQLEDDFEESIRDELNKNIDLLDMSEMKFNDGTIRFIAEIYEDGDDPQYLLEDNGKIICKLF